MTISQAASALALLSTLYFCPPATNADDGASKVTTVSVPGGGKPVVAKTDKEGVIHLLYDSKDGPKYAKSSDGGLTFGPPISVVGEESRPEGLEYSAEDMAVGKGGRIHVAMGTNAWKLKLPQEEWGFFYASLDPGATAFSPVRNINRKPSEGFSLAADDEGKVTACWLSDRLYANVSHDNGKTFEPFVEMNTHFNPCNCCTTSAAYGENRKSYGGLFQVTYKLPETNIKLGANYGTSRLSRADNEINPTLVHLNDKFTLGVYDQLTPNLMLLAEGTSMWSRNQVSDENKAWVANVGAFVSF